MEKMLITFLISSLSAIIIVYDSVLSDAVYCMHVLNICVFKVYIIYVIYAYMCVHVCTYIDMDSVCMCVYIYRDINTCKFIQLYTI